MDGVVGCDVAWTAVGLIACRLSDCCSWITLYLFRLDGIQSSSPYMVRLFCFHFGFALRYIYRRFGIIRILGIPVGRYASVLFLFFAQRCGGKCQYMGGNRGNYCNGCLCGGIIRDIPWRAVAETGFRTHEDTLSAFEAIGGTVAADRIIVYPDSRRIYSLHHEYREGVFQYRPALDHAAIIRLSA